MSERKKRTPAVLETAFNSANIFFLKPFCVRYCGDGWKFKEHRYRTLAKGAGETSTRCSQDHVIKALVESHKNMEIGMICRNMEVGMI